MAYNHVITPCGIQCIRYRTLATLITTTISNEDDVLKAVHLQAVRDIGEESFKRLLLETECTRAAHMPTWWVDRAFRYELHNRSAQRVPKFSGDRITV